MRREKKKTIVMQGWSLFEDFREYISCMNSCKIVIGLKGQLKKHVVKYVFMIVNGTSDDN